MTSPEAGVGGGGPAEEIVLALDPTSAAAGGDARVRLLNRVREALQRAPDVPGLLVAVVETLRTSLVVTPERVRVEIAAHDGDGSHLGGHDERGTAGHDVPVSSTVRRRVLDGRESLLVADAADAFGSAGSVRALRIGSLLAVPLLDGVRTVGALFAYHGGDRAPFSRGDLELATALAGLLAYEVEARRLRRALERENEALRLHAAGTDEFVGVAPRTVALLDAVARAADSPFDVLLVGESGTGKERLARRVHDRSPRRAGPFVAVDCGALPAELVESELFGHVRGAFTGATRDRVGRFAEADGGTLFLDEVGNLAPEAQPKLLRALETRRVTPVGGDGARGVDVRVVAATNVALERLVEEGRFRPDLYYRLAVLVVELPPLRDRLEDLPLLVAAFLRAVPGPARRFTGDALSALAARRWPGNLRELRNVVWRTATLASADPIGVADLAPETAPTAPAGGGGGGGTSLADVERRAIGAALRAAGGNKTRASEILGISRDTLYRKLAEPTT